MATIFQVTFDCAHAAAQAGFWAAALGYRPADPPAGSDTWEEWLEKMEVPEDEWDEGAWITDPDRRGPSIFFQQVPEPKTVKNRVHLDLDVSAGSAVPLDRRKAEVDGQADRLLALGARRLEAFEQGDHYHVVMQDPEGNEFCLLRPAVAGEPRLAPRCRRPVASRLGGIRGSSHHRGGRAREDRNRPAEPDPTGRRRHADRVGSARRSGRFLVAGDHRSHRLSEL